MWNKIKQWFLPPTIYQKEQEAESYRQQAYRRIQRAKEHILSAAQDIDRKNLQDQVQLQEQQRKLQQAAHEIDDVADQIGKIIGPR